MTTEKHAPTPEGIWNKEEFKDYHKTTWSFEGKKNGRFHVMKNGVPLMNREELQEVLSLLNNYDSLQAELARLKEERRRWAIQILKVRDELTKEYPDEAYHQLYQIGSSDFTSYEPWEQLEALASAEKLNEKE